MTDFLATARADDPVASREFFEILFPPRPLAERIQREEFNKAAFENRQMGKKPGESWTDYSLRLNGTYERARERIAERLANDGS